MKVKLKLLFVIVICGVLSLSSSALELSVDILTPKKALDTALKNNLRIKVIEASVPIAEADLIIAKYRPNPIIGSNSEIITGGSLHAVQIGTVIETGKKRHWRMEKAKEQISKVKLQVEKMIWEIRTEVRIAYVALAVKKGYLELAKNRLIFFKSLLNSAQKQLQRKKVTEVDLERVNIELLRSENLISGRLRDITENRIDLNQLLHKDLDERFDILNIKEFLPKIEFRDYPELKELLQKALEKRIEIALLEKEYGITRAELKVAQSGRIPNVYIEGALARPTRGVNVWGPYVGGFTEVPIFNRKQGEIKGSVTTLEYLENEKKRTEENVSAEVTKAYNDLLLNEERVKKFREQITNHSDTLLQKTIDGYEKGIFILSDIIEAEERKLDVDENYLTSILDYQTSLARLEYAIGEPIFEF